MPKRTARKHVFFLDDESKVREVVKETLEGANIRVTCFSSPRECLAQLRSQKFDMLITDLRMPEKDGLELLAEVKSLVPWVPVLMITGYGDVPTAVKAIKGGAVDFIEKPLGKRDFLHRVTSILQESALANMSQREPLTRTEIQVLRLIIDGKTNREIASDTHRSVRTIEVHRAHIMRKCGVDDIVDLIKQCAMIEGVRSQSKQGSRRLGPDSDDSE